MRTAARGPARPLYLTVTSPANFRTTADFFPRAGSRAPEYVDGRALPRVKGREGVWLPWQRCEARAPDVTVGMGGMGDGTQRDPPCQGTGRNRDMWKGKV